MEMIILLAVISLVLGNLPRPSALPMTDYSQLNHDEPTHWTKAATTHVPTTGEYVAKRGTAATESTKAESSKNTPTTIDQENDLTTKSGVFNTNDIVYPENETTTNLDLDFEKIINSTQKVENLTKTVKFIKVTEPTTDDNYDEEKPDRFYRYDLVEDLRKLFTNDLEKDDDRNATENEIKVNKFDYNQENFDSEQEEEELKRDDIIKPKLVYDSLAMPTLSELDESYDADTPFKKWDRDSEEQEKLLENIVFQANNDTFDKMEIEKRKVPKNKQAAGDGFLLLLAGNSTIVRLRQKDFAKYLKLNLAARLSLEYDEVKLNKVVLAPPRLMVNVSVIPSSMGNLDEEFDLNERLFGEEEAPLHKLAETNATLLELSGEEYHVVRFLSLRSQQPLAMDEVASETSVVITDHHADIEKVVYIWVGMICIFLLIPLIVALCRLYLFPAQIKWPWKRDKPLFGGAPWSLPRHQRMEEPVAPIGGPLTVIYSGAFVDRNGPPSGSWIDENYQSSSIRDEPNLENPVYGFGLDKTTVRDICDPSVLESPRFNLDSKLRILGCRPNHLLIPHTPIKRAQQKSNLDLRIPKGLDNPNYQT